MAWFFAGEKLPNSEGSVGRESIPLDDDRLNNANQVLELVANECPVEGAIASFGHYLRLLDGATSIVPTRCIRVAMVSRRLRMCLCSMIWFRYQFWAFGHLKAKLDEWGKEMSRNARLHYSYNERLEV